jgi:hypothetical protein
VGWGEAGGGILNPNKSKGTRWESSVRDFLNSTGQSAHRIAQAGADVSDVHLNGLWALQCKDQAQQRYAEWVPASEQQAANAGLVFSAVVHKRRNRPVGEALVVMTLDQFSDIANRLRVAESMIRSRDDSVGP